MMDEAISDDELHMLETVLSKLSGRGGSLPPAVFRFVTEVSATVNVDLLVRDNENRLLLAWRDDAFGTGWHVPGSIIRHREEIAHRIAACARDEFGCDVDAAAEPAAVLQIFDDRGHSVSLCFTASLRGSPGRRVVKEGDDLRSGDLCWFAAFPQQVYPSHLIYREVLEALDRGELGRGARVFTQHAGQRDADQASPEGMIRADLPLS
jgi:ADP-ribose pyrophosphatase YjhB (NUDIX family)